MPPSAARPGAPAGAVGELVAGAVSSARVEPSTTPPPTTPPRAPRGATAALLGLAAVLFAASLPLTAYEGSASSGVVEFPGFFMLLMGAMGILAGHVGWFANLLLPVTGVLTLVSRRVPLIIAVVTGVLGLGLAASSYPTLATLSMVGNNEGEMARFESFGPAIHLWVACHALTLAAAITALVRLPRAGATPAPAP